MDIKNQSEQIIRLSLGWMLILASATIVLGAVGGVLAQQTLTPRQPLPGTDDRLQTTVQQVTISPNKSAAEIVSAAQRSVVLLGTVSPTGVRSISTTGLVMTTDGLIVSPRAPLTAPVVLFDDRGVATALDVVGTDPVFGLTYYRIKDGVFPALDVRRDDPPVGYTLLTIGRSAVSSAATVTSSLVGDYALPADSLPRGIQRLIHTTPVNDERLTGAPLIDEDGRLAGLMLDPTAGTALPISLVQNSLDRVVNGQREAEPLKDAGLAWRYAWQPTELTGPVHFGMEVTAVTPNTLAAQSGLKVGDFIYEFDRQPLDGAVSPVVTWAKKRPASSTVWRQAQSLVLTIPSS